MSLKVSEGHNTSCNFSPGLTPVILSLIFGSKALAKSTILIDGDLGINSSPPNHFF